MDLRDQLQQTLGGTYTLEQELGGGGMSRVFVATETGLSRRVVVKVLPGEMAGHLSVDRFKREISIAARLQNAHIVPLLAAGEVNGLPYFTMPFVEGESLRARIAREGRLSINDAVRMLREIASALSYAHTHGVVHRDMKPDNVLLSSGSAMVTDFGVAKALSDSGNASEGLTGIGLALGTPAYMAPEQATADPNVDHRADIYSWGMIAYELLTGQSPFAGRTAQAMLAAQVVEAPQTIAQLRPELSPALAQLVMKTLEKAPGDRPQSAEELVRALDAIGTSGEIGGAAPTRDRATAVAWSRRTAVAGGAIAVVLIAITVAWFANRNSTAIAANASRGLTASEMTLAVLPIENLGGDSTTEYLADGMTGELSGALKKIPELQVAGDISTFRFKGKHTAPEEIARELKVHMMLTGRLTSGKESVRLQMQLSDATGKLMWTKTFTSVNKDNFALEDSITNAVANEVRVVLSPKTVASTRAGRTINPEAHDLVLHGQFERNKLTSAGLKRAVTYYQQAIKLDPNYAQAYAGLAFSYDIQADVFEDSHVYHLLALNAAKRAVEIDSLLPEAHVLYGYELAAANWDFEVGIAEMDHGLAMNPNSSDGLFMRGLFAWITGDQKHAVALADRLMKIDPLSALPARLRADALTWGGNALEGLKADSVANALDATVQNAESTTGTAMYLLGRYDGAVAAFLNYQKMTETPSWGLAMTYGKMGKLKEARDVIRAIEAREKKQWVDPDFVAISYAAIGDNDKAMEWMEKAYRVKTFSLRALMNWDMPWFRSMKDDARFVALQKKVLETKFD
ncbi:MAG: protein kinase [Gemmatimonadaceae bacterium]